MHWKRVHSDEENSVHTWSTVGSGSSYADDGGSMTAGNVQFLESCIQFGRWSGGDSLKTSLLILREDERRLSRHERWIVSLYLTQCLLVIQRPWAVSMAVGRSLNGISLKALDKRSTATRMPVFLLDGGRPVIKSIPRWNPGRWQRQQNDKLVIWWQLQGTSTSKQVYVWLPHSTVTCYKLQRMFLLCCLAKLPWICFGNWIVFMQR